MKKLSIFLIIIMVISYSGIATAKSNKNKPLHKKNITVHNQLLTKAYNIDQDQLNFFAKFNLTNQELSLVFYLYANSNRTVTESDIDFIITNKDNWPKLSWYFGLPPILMESEIIYFHRHQHSRIQPPITNEKYEKKRTNEYEEEKLEIKPGKYEYFYKNTRLGLEEKVEIKKNKYSYYYQDKYITEKLEVKYPSYHYEYYYKNHNTGVEIKKEGIGQPLNPDVFYQNLEKKIETNPDFHFSLDIKIDINL